VVSPRTPFGRRVHPLVRFWCHRAPSPAWKVSMRGHPRRYERFLPLGVLEQHCQQIGGCIEFGRGTTCQLVNARTPHYSLLPPTCSLPKFSFEPARAGELYDISASGPSCCKSLREPSREDGTCKSYRRHRRQVSQGSLLRPCSSRLRLP
jgi:hypothetical protein